MLISAEAASCTVWKVDWNIRIKNIFYPSGSEPIKLNSIVNFLVECDRAVANTKDSKNLVLKLVICDRTTHEKYSGNFKRVDDRALPQQIKPNLWGCWGGGAVQTSAG